MKICSIGTATPVPGEQASSVKMGNEAIARCLEKATVPKSEIGLLLYCGIYRDEYIGEPAMAALLAGAANMDEGYYKDDHRKLLAFDVLNSSLGFLNACQIVATMTGQSNTGHSLIVTAEVDNNLQFRPNPGQGGAPNGKSDIAETGAALLLSPDADTGFGFFYFQEFSHHLEVSRSEICLQPDGPPVLRVTKANELESCYAGCISAAVQAMLKGQGWQLADFDFIIPPQISPSFVRKLVGILQLDPEKTIDITKDRKDLLTAAIPFAFDHLLKERRPSTGQRALIIGIGSGVQVGCAVYEF